VPAEVPPIAQIPATPYGTWEIVRRGEGLAILAVGTMVGPALEAARQLPEIGVHPTVVNCRYLKPYDRAMLADLVRDHRNILVVEEGSVVNGFGAYITSVIAAMDSAARVIIHGVPDDFIDQAPRARQLALLGLDARGIAQRTSDAFGLESSRGTHLRAV
jgi:1-deoxy-D-xylulose-5-phosphate synthase